MSYKHTVDVLTLQMTRTRVGSDGFVQLIDVMGSDVDIINAARVSTTTDLCTVVGPKEAKLLRYLLHHKHTSPFEMCELKFHIRLPVDVMRQWIRHRTANVNEYSMRYREAIDSCDIPKAGEWRMQSDSNKQCSAGALKDAWHLTEKAEHVAKTCHNAYQELLDAGAAREQARRVLPLFNYTEAYWKIDLHNLLHFLELRTHEHAQKEIRDFANVILGIVEKLFPYTYAAFQSCVLKASTFTFEQKQIIRKALLNGGKFDDELLRKLPENERKQLDDQFGGAQ